MSERLPEKGRKRKADALILAMGLFVFSMFLLDYATRLYLSGKAIDNARESRQSVHAR